MLVCLCRQHPECSVLEGERLIKSVYETLRASSIWNDLLFIVNYDEHGGFFDHVSPPMTNVPNPDGACPLTRPTALLVRFRRC